VILVTGGSGFIGSNIAAALAARGDRVVICDRFGNDHKWRNIAKHAVYDLVLPDDLDAWIARNPDDLAAIIHMGAISSTIETNVDLIIASNVTLSLKLWNLAIDRGIPFIYASSAATYGDGAHGFKDEANAAALARLRPLNPYGWSKHVIDRRIISDVAAKRPTPPVWAGLKFFNVYGPNEYHKGGQRSVVQQLFETVRETGRASLFKSHNPDYADGGQARDFVYVADCVQVVLWLLDHGVSGLFNLGTGQARSFHDLARAVFAAMGKQEHISFVPTPDNLRDQYQYWTQADMTHLRSVGYKAPFTSLEDGVSDYIKQFLAKDDPYR
jgi:ADP-L-glycero-D-manno-heptose 6-epimerase